MRRSWSTFVFVFCGILCSAAFYVGSRLAQYPWQWAVVIAMTGSVALMPLVLWRARGRDAFRGKERLQQLIYVSMGFLSWLLVVTFFRDLVLLGAYVFGGGPLGNAWTEASLGTPAFLAAILITALGSWRALRGPHVRTVVVPIVGLPKDLSGMRIAQITDLHVGPTIGRSYVERTVALIEELRPDFTVMTGDIVDGSPKDLANDVAPMVRLAANGRVFYVPGNHEYYSDFARWVPKLQELGITLLLNRGEKIERAGVSVWVGGITDPAGAQIGKGDAPDIAGAARGGEKCGVRVLLAHRPDLAREAAQAGFDLQLSGHTHGGQFFPWTHVAGFFHRHYLGLLRAEQMWIYVSPGTGSWGPPMRLGTTPEVTLLRLETAK